MAIITLEYNARNSVLKSLIEQISSVKGITIIEKDSPKYSKKMIEKINQSKKEFVDNKCKVIKTEELFK